MFKGVQNKKNVIILYVERKISKIKKEKIYILYNGITSSFTGFF